MIKKIISIISILIIALPAQAQSSRIDPDQRYLLLATTKTATMQKELDEASAQGFRVVASSTTSGVEMVLLLERPVQPSDTYKYKLLATTRTSTMQKELNEAAAEGFRLIPSTMISKKQPVFGVEEVVLLLERPPKSDRRYEYKLLATTRTSTLQKEIMDSQVAGFILVGVVSRGEHMVIMEREF
jgi:hypothetical protein